MNTLDSIWNVTAAGSIRASALILCVLLLRLALRGRVPAQCFHVLWLLVVVRLLMPFAPVSSFSVFSVRTPVEESAASPRWRVRIAESTAPVVSADTRHAISQSGARSVRPGWDVRMVFPALWIAGVVAQVIVLGWSALKMRRHLVAAGSISEPRLTVLAAECAQRLRLKGEVPLLESDAISGPAVIGLWCPRLLLPRGLAAQLSDDELRFVLLHECAHLRRRDLVALWIMTIARVLHWFNPLVWLAARLARTDAEMARDATPVAYGEALLKLAQIVTWRRPSLPVAGIVESKRAMRARLAGIGRYAPRKAVHTWFAAVLVLGVGLVFGVDEKKVVAPPETTAAAEPAPAHSSEVAARGTWAEGWSVHWVSFPPMGSEGKPKVDFQKPDGSSLSLTLGAQTDDGVKIVDAKWLDAPGTEFERARVQLEEFPNDSRRAGTAMVEIQKGDVSVIFAVSGDSVSWRDGLELSRPQVEIEARFIEINETTARRLKSSGTGAKARDNAGIEFLSARLGGEPGVHVLTDSQHRIVLQSLATQTGMDLLSAPKVTTRSGQRAIIEIIREFRYPTEFDPKPEGGWNPKSFETRNCGVTLEAEPSVNDEGAITLKLAPQVVEFLGFRDIDTGKRYPAKFALSRSPGGNGIDQKLFGSSNFPASAILGNLRPQTFPVRRELPVFSARKIETTVTLPPGHAVLFVGIRESENAEGFPSRAASHRLAVLVSARLISPNGEPLDPKAATAPVPAHFANGDLPKGLQVPEKPCFVRSPFAPDAGYVDVRGFASGSEVKCPYSGKLFLVP